MDGWSDEYLLASLAFIFFIISSVILELAVGSIFSFMIILYLFSLRKPGAVQWDAGRHSLGKSAVGVMVGLVFFVWLGNYILSNFSSFASFDMSAVFAAWHGYSTVTFLIDIPWVKFLVWGVMIPVAETCFLGGILGLLRYKWFKTTRGKFSLDTAMVVVLTGAVFAIVHIVARLMANDALLLDAAFFAFSAYMSVHYGQLKEAGLLHILVNSMTFGVVGA